MASRPETLPISAFGDVVLPRTRADAVATELRRGILSGDLKPGTRLRQADVAKHFAVSTTPVREAFAALAREGLVRQDAHRGAVVFMPSFQDLRENYEIRGILEPSAAEFAATRISREELDVLDGLVEEIPTSIDRGDVELANSLNREFHLRIYAAAGRPKLVELIDSLRDAATAYLQILESQKMAEEYVRAVRDEHRAIVAALRAAAPERAGRAMRTHLERNRQQLEDVLRSRLPTVSSSGAQKPSGLLLPGRPDLTLRPYDGIGAPHADRIPTDRGG